MVFISSKDAPLRAKRGFARRQTSWGGELHSGKRLIEYIGRYIRHPAIANSRIDRYNGEVVRFFYEDHEGKAIRKVMKIFDFISAIIQHIPEKHFRLVRYYGACARRKTGIVKSFIQQSII